MKIKEGIIIKQLDNEYILIDSGIILPRFNGMIKLNETSNFIVSSLLEKDLTFSELVLVMLNKYDASKEEIESSIKPILSSLSKANILINYNEEK